MGASAAGSTVMERLERITVVIAGPFSFTTVILALRLQ